MLDIILFVEKISPYLVIMLTAVVGWLGAYMVPRALKAKRQAEASISETDALGKRLDLYNTELGRATVSNKRLARRVRALSRRVTRQDKRIAGQEMRIADLEAHMDDLYQSIEQEEAPTQERIKGRLKTKRPARRQITGRDTNTNTNTPTKGAASWEHKSS